MKKAIVEIKDLLWVAGICLFLAGCSQPLRTLMDLGSEQKAQQSYVRKEKTRFDVLLRDAKRSRLKLGTPRAQVISRYGEPILESGKTMLYRPPVEFFGAPKVYLDFDQSDQLAGIRIIKEEHVS